MQTQDKDIGATILDAYTRLDYHQLQLFLRLRALSQTGSHSELAFRLTEFDLLTYSPSFTRFSPPATLSAPKPCHPNVTNSTLVSGTPHCQILSDLPIDIIAEILDKLGSWELSKAVGVPTSLSRPPEWDSSATPLDFAILSSSLSQVRATHISPPFTQLGATILIQFGMLDILDYLWNVPTLRGTFRKHYGESFSSIPTLASLHNRPHILDWWLAQPDINPKAYSSDAIDNACRNAALAALAWWDANSDQSSRLVMSQSVVKDGKGIDAVTLHDTSTTSRPYPPLYTAQALEAASRKAHISVLAFFVERSWPLRPGRALDQASAAGNVQVLDWWAYNSGLEIGKDVKYDRNAVYHASCAGKVDVLAWWKEQSERGKGKGGKGIQMIYDEEALVGATRHNKPEVLEWWDKSGLPISYRMCDIEAALEDAIGGGDAARAWWARKGVNFRAGDSEWMKMQSLN